MYSSSGLPDALEKNLEQRRMAVQRTRDYNLQTVEFAGNIRYETRQVAFQVEPQREEVRHHHEALVSFFGKFCDCPFEAGPAEFEEGRLDPLESPGAFQVAGGGADRLVGRFDAGAVGENHDGGASDDGIVP